MCCEIVVGGATESETRAIEGLFAERDRRFSRFRTESELNAVNTAGEAMLVSSSFAAALKVALEAAAATGGLVDPTLGAALVAAGYDRDFDALEGAEPRPHDGLAPTGCWESVRLT